MTQTVPTGQVVADRFLILRFSAAGGMGEVYEAEDRALGDRVALKFLNRRSIGDEQVLRRFRREIQLARKVTHRNVCRLHDLYQYTPETGLLSGHETIFVTMELLPGETLEEYLERKGPLSEQEALPLIHQMAEALTAAHLAGVIHRDFKTSNVMLVPRKADDSDLRVVVTDFGLARPSSKTAEDTQNPLTGEMRIVGTADYMSPEQLYGEDVTAASDVYAFGVVIFEMVTGRKPYTATNPMTLLAKRVSEPPASPTDFAADLEKHWNQTILDCLENDPGERIQSPRDVVLALGGEDFGFTPQSSGTVTLPTDWLRAVKRRETEHRHARRRWARLAGALLIILAGLGLWFGLQGRQETPAYSNFVQLTTAPGLELDPAFSPDSDFLVYSSDQSGTFEIYVRDLSPGGQERQLTDDGNQNFEPGWSPDGSTIAFHSKLQGGIWLVPAEGGTSKRLTQTGSRPDWSPDSSTLVYQTESSPLLSDTTAPALSLSTLWLVGQESEEPRQLTRIGQPPGGHATPAFSPDGQRVVFSVSPQRGAAEIWSIGVDGENLHLMSREPAIAYDPTYSADGHFIYFSGQSREVNALWRVPVSQRTGKSTGPPAQFSNLGGLASIRQAATSVDGSKIAYVAIKTISNLWSLPIDSATGLPSGRSTELTVGAGRNNRPIFSPDGTRLAFDRWQHGFNIALWAMDSDGTNTRQVTVEPMTSTQPSWLPSGEHLAYQRLEEGRRTYWSTPLSGGAGSQLAELEADVDWAKLSPDGTRLAYHTKTRGLGFNLWIMNLVDGRSHQLTFADDFMGFPCWSPDGKWLAFQHKVDKDSHLMVMPSEGGEPIQLTHEAGHNWPFSFSPDSDKVAFAAFRDGEWNLWWISRATGVQQRLTESPRLNAYVRYPAWSPANDRIVYELAETTGDISLSEVSD